MPRERKNAKNKDTDGEGSTRGRKKRGSGVNSSSLSNNIQSNMNNELYPPAPHSRDTLYANNPFDDFPPMPMSQHRVQQLQPPPPSSSIHMSRYPPHNKGNDKMFPLDRQRVLNTANPHAPPVYVCGICQKEVHDNDQAIMCESGCSFWHHRICTGLTQEAFALLNNEVYAEWACNNCFNKNGSIIKCKP